MIGNVLIVEDNRDLAELMTDRFNDHDIHTKCSTSGKEAIDVIKEMNASETPPSLCILDVIIPGLSGVELMKEISGVLPDIRFMLITGYTDIPDIKAMEDEGIVEVFYKPFRISELIAKAEFVLSNRSRIAKR